MPQGSGLELLARIREGNYSIQTILLTNYADFNYAQKAIELQSFEYFLKPIEFDKLMLIIQKAVTQAKEQQRNEKAIQSGYFWQKNQSKILEHFWRKLVSGSTSFPIKPADITHAIEEQNLSYQMSDTLQPLIIIPFFIPIESSSRGSCIASSYQYVAGCNWPFSFLSILICMLSESDSYSIPVED